MSRGALVRLPGPRVFDLMPAAESLGRPGDRAVEEARRCLEEAHARPFEVIDVGCEGLIRSQLLERVRELDPVVVESSPAKRAWFAAVAEVGSVTPWPDDVETPPTASLSGAAVATALESLRREDPARARGLIRALEQHQCGIDPRLDAFVERRLPAAGAGEAVLAGHIAEGPPAPAHIAIEGVDASGKSTQAAAVARWLERRGYGAEVRKSCRGGAFYRRITRIMQESEARGDRHFWRWCRLAKAQDTARVISRAHRERSGEPHAVMVWDRHRLTHLAAALARFEYDPGVEEITGHLPAPRAAFLLDLPVGVSLGRLDGRGEAKTLDEHPLMLGRYRRAFLRIAGAHGYEVLDARLSAPEITQRILSSLEPLFPDRSGGGL